MEANEIIQEIQKEKREKNIIPDGALWSEIINRASAELKKELNTLVKEKKIRFNKTLNDLMFYSNED